MKNTSIFAPAFSHHFNLAVALAALEHIPVLVNVLARRAVDEVCKPLVDFAAQSIPFKPDEYAQILHHRRCITEVALAVGKRFPPCLRFPCEPFRNLAAFVVANHFSISIPQL